MGLVDANSNPMMRWIVRIAIETSMRSSEITGLRKSQVDLGKRVVRLLQTKKPDAADRGSDQVGDKTLLRGAGQSASAEGLRPRLLRRTRARRRSAALHIRRSAWLRRR